jgi:molybdate transport system permease protein
MSRRLPAWSDVAFYLPFIVLGGSYVLLIVAMVAAELSYTSPGHLLEQLRQPYLRDSIILTLVSCSLSTVFSLLVGIPLGYLMSRHRFPLKWLVDAILDIPVVLPPLVVGLCLLMLFQCWPLLQLQQVFPITYHPPSVVIGQFAVAAAFAVRTMKVTFDQISPRTEQVALTLGCTRTQAFYRVVLPQARRGVVTAATLAWARSLGEFGPIFVFAGTTRGRTEVLASTVYLELSNGALKAAVAVSLLMVATAFLVLLIVRRYGVDREE